jgi:hypothetical protein
MYEIENTRDFKNRHNHSITQLKRNDGMERVGRK